MDKVVHFEIPAKDMKRAEDFYQKSFGWKMNSMPEMGYSVVQTVEVDENRMPKESGAINGGIFKVNEEREDSLKSVNVIIDVKSIDESMKTLLENGGELVRDKQKVGEMGYVAYFKDTEGNVLGIWETIKK